MVTARDAHDDWYEDDEPYGDVGERRHEYAPHPLKLVRPARFAFEVIAPQDFEAAQTIADSVRAGTPVLVDFHGCDAGLTGRLTDFCSGLAYAVEATLQHLGSEVILIAPGTISISGDVESVVRTPGFFNRS